MRYADMPPESQAAIARVGALLDSEAAWLGPTSPLANAEHDEDELPAQVVMTEWVVCSAFADTATGQTWTCYFTSPGLPTHHATGLIDEIRDRLR